MMREKPELAAIKPIRESQSKYDIMLMGKQLRFKVEPCEKGKIDVSFVIEEKLGDAIPKFLKEIIPGPEDNATVTRPLVRKCLKISWWEKIIGRTLEWKACKWASDRRAEFESFARRQDEAERIRKAIG